METKKETRKNEIRKTGRELLVSGGYEEFNMRSVAKTCGMSVGALYDYYTGKDEMVRDIMLTDWKNEMTLIREQIGQKRCNIGKARLVYDSIISYEARYMKLRCDCTARRDYRPYENRLHLYVISDLREVSGFDRFTLEILLRYASLPDQNFDDIEAKLRILL